MSVKFYHLLSLCAHELRKCAADNTQFFIPDAGVEANEEGVVHDEVCVRQVPRNAMGNVLICGVAQKVAAEEVARFDAVGFQICSDVVAGEPGAFPDGEHVTKPGGIGILSGPGKDEIGFVGFIEFIEFVEVIFSSGDELLEFPELGAADGSLHGRHLEVVTDMAVNVLVIITEGQGAELLTETFPAGVAFATGAVAIPAPVPDGAGDAGQVVVIGGHAATFAQGNVMGRVEGKGGEVAVCAR